MRIDPYPRFPADPRYAERKLTDLFRDIAALLNPTTNGERTLLGVDTSDDLVIDMATSGLVLKDTQSPAHYWRITIDTTGALVSTDLGTTKP